MGRIVAVDLDNTLTNRHAMLREWASAFMDEHRIDDRDAVDVLVELDRDGRRDKHEMFAEVASRWGLASAVDELVDDFYAALVRLHQPEPAVLDALDGLRARGYAVVVVTNGSRRQIDKIAAMGLLNHVDASVVSSLVGHRKPDREIFDVAARRIGGSLGDVVWVIGDGVADVVGAHNIGARSIWLHRGRHGTTPASDPT